MGPNLALAASAALGAAIGGAARFAAGNPALASRFRLDPAIIPWLVSGGSEVLGLTIFAACAFIAVTLAATRDLAHIRTRLAAETAGAAAPRWTGAFGGGSFAAIAALGEALSSEAAPWALPRLVRATAWRRYARRCISIVIVVLAVGAVLGIAEPAALIVPPAIGPWQALVALFATAVAAAALVFDAAVDRVCAAILSALPAHRIIPAASGDQAGALPNSWVSRIEELVAALDGFVAAIRTQPASNAPVVEELVAMRREMVTLAKRLDERVSAVASPPFGDPGLPEATVVGLTGALSELARALEKLPADSVASRWNEIEAGLREMGATLAGIAGAVSVEQRPRTLTDEIDELLEEISDDPAPPRRRPPRHPSR